MSIQSLFTKKPPSKEPEAVPDNGIIKDILHRLQELRDRKPGGQSAYLGDHTAICRTVFGHKIYIDTRDISLAPHLAMDGIWEMWITEAMSRLLRPGMACVDLGTNFGWYSLLMADRIGPKGHLIGADANIRMVDLCRKSMSVNGFLDRAHIHHAAITDRIGDVTFSALESYMGSGSLKDMGDTATQFHDHTVTMTVPGQTLDALTKGRAIDFMKIDCEGAEPGIIRGGLETLKSPDLQIFMEYAPGFYAPGEAAAMIGTLADAGFSFFSIDTQSRFESMSRDALLNLVGWSELYLKRGKL